MRRLLSIIIFSSAVPACAAWTGDITQSVEKGFVSIGYQTATRSVKSNSLPGGTLDYKDHGMVLEDRTALNPVVQFALRVLPFTGRENLERTSFNPHMAGGGAGLYFAPPETLGPVHLGAAAIWDGAGGISRRDGPEKRYDRIFTSEATLAAGASYAPIESLNVYAGGEYVSFQMRLSVPGSKTNWRQDSPWGGFAGVSFVSNQAWVVGGEFHFGGERSFGASLGYKY